MKIDTILNQIDLGAMALPEFQRGYVWNRNQVRELMNSLYHRYPIGGLLVWVTRTEDADARGDHRLSAGNVELILDGQQRVSTLYGVIKGTPPPFFQGNARAFEDLYSNLEDESFEFYGPVKMRDNPHWISVTDLMKQGLDTYIDNIYQNPVLQPYAGRYIGRLNRILSIRDVEFHIEKVTGEDKTVDVVVDIFNRVNSGGTKLSKGDLALARVCAEWPDARNELRSRLKKWKDAGFNFETDWFLRSINTVLTGEAMFSALKDASSAEFSAALLQSEGAIDYLLNLISGRLGLDHDRVLGSRYAFPIMTRYVVESGGKFRTARERDKLLYWYVHTLLWGRFAGSTETTLNQDLGVMERESGDSLDRLIDQMRISRGDLVVRAENFGGWSLGARFYPMLYMLTRVGEARDWGTGLPLRANMLGKTSRLEIHHIFPRSLMYPLGYDKPHVNALANFCFQTQSTNLSISNRPPAEYFENVEENHPGALASQWIPMDRNLWQTDRFLDFLAARRELLAQASNEFLDNLLVGPEWTSVEDVNVGSLQVMAVPGGISGTQEEEALLEVNIWISENELPEGELLYELSSSETGDMIAILDLAWPTGLQTGFSEPVALLLDEDYETLELASGAGFRCFTDAETFRQYVNSEILVLEPR